MTRIIKIILLTAVFGVAPKLMLIQNTTVMAATINPDDDIVELDTVEIDYGDVKSITLSKGYSYPFSLNYCLLQPDTPSRLGLLEVPDTMTLNIRIQDFYYDRQFCDSLPERLMALNLSIEAVTPIEDEVFERRHLPFVIDGLSHLCFCDTTELNYVTLFLRGGTYLLSFDGVDLGSEYIGYEEEANRNTPMLRTSVEALPSYTLSLSVEAIPLRDEGSQPAMPIPDGYNMVSTFESRDGTSSNGLTTYVLPDDLGREHRTVVSGVTPDGHSLVTLKEYDAMGRPSVLWLPGKTTVDMPSADDIPFLSMTTHNDDDPYSQTVYEESPLNRVSAQYGAGQSWYQADKAVQTNYQTNSPLNNYYSCARLSASPTATGSVSVSVVGVFPAGRLDVVETTDEDGNTTMVFNDFDDRTVLVRVVGSQGVHHDTYFIYDALGRLLAVLPPQASSTIGTNSGTVDDDVLSNYAYLYRYDGLGRQTGRKLPGCGWTYMYYDEADRLILLQDGKQRTDGEATFHLYDIHGRECVSGICHNAVSLGGSLSQYVFCEYTGGQGTLCGYSTSGITLLQPEVNHVAYYDNYDFVSDFTTGLPDLPLAYGTEATSAQGHQTGALEYVFTPETGQRRCNYSIIRYDDRMRVAHTETSNLRGGTDVEDIALNFTGHPLIRTITHSAKINPSLPVSPLVSHTEEYNYTYDHAGRLLTTTHSLNGGTAVVLASNAYDDLGRLSSVSRGGNNNLATTYNYNVRSWTTSISSPLFSENLYYTDNPLSSGNKLYGGNIAAMTWRAGDAKVRGYDFNYDPLSRLTKAGYYENSSLNNHYTTEYSYDLMGNMLTLRRNGLQDGNIYGLIDQLSCTYSGNQLQQVTDAVEDPTWQGAFNFMDGADQQTEYEYDENGNLTKDLNKNISRITYNFLNLPKEIMFMDGSYIHYTYDAAGTLLRKGYYVGEELTEIPGDDEEELTGFCLPDTHLMSVGDEEEEEDLVEEEEEIPYTDVTDYCGNYVYENGTLKTILIEDGYITFDSNSQPVYHFYLQDHLGNNRVVANASGQVEQVNHYYPYGGLMAESTGGDVQRYKYNGKELDRMLGLDWYDYGARHYDGALTVWGTMDPLCEKYYNISPYVYCGNNPINAFDPDGRLILFAKGVSDSFKKDFANAVNYLNSHECGYLLKALNDSPNIYYIKESDDVHNSFDYKSKTIVWNPNMGIKTNELQVLSPSTLLNHEIDHALAFDKNPSQYLNDIRMYNDNHPDNLYYSLEEKRVITGSEQKTALALGEINEGEITRTDHSGSHVPVSSPTSNIPLLKEQEFIVKPKHYKNDLEVEK